MSDPDILMIHMEPSPYVVALVRELQSTWRGRIDLLLVGSALTQPWEDRPNGPSSKILPARYAAAVREVWRRLKSQRYKILHLDGWGNPVMLSAMLMAAVLRIPVVVETDTPPPSRTPSWRRAVKRLAYPLLFRLPAMFLPFGSRQAAYLRSYGVSDKRMLVTQMVGDIDKIRAFCAGFDMEARAHFLHAQGIARNVTRFLYVGRLETYKGVGDLLEAFRKLHKARDDVHLVMVGGGSLAQFASSVAQEIGSISCLGRLEGEDLWRAYGTASVFVLASHRDNWGMVIGEAMAAGLPVIASDRVGCIDDLVQPDVTGLVFSAGSQAGLCDAMRLLANDGAERLSMGKEAARRIASWSTANSAKRIAAAWRGVST